MTDKDYWFKETLKNGGILPDNFVADSGLTDNYGFANALWNNTDKIENFSKFTAPVVEKFLKEHPYMMEAFRKSEVFNKDFLEDLMVKVPETLKNVEDEDVILRITEKEPKSVMFISDEFKMRPEYTERFKKLMMGEIELSPQEFEENLIYNLPASIRNDKEFFANWIQKDASYCRYYRFFGKNIRDDLELTKIVLKNSPDMISYVGEELLKTEKGINEAYFLRNPHKFSELSFAPKDTANEELLEKVLRYDLGNFNLLTGKALETETVKKVRFALDRLEKLQENAAKSLNLTADKNMIYDLVSDKEIMSMPDEVLKSLLEYDAQPCRELLEISKKKELPYLQEYLDLVFTETGKNQRSAYNAIVTYKNVASVMKEVYAFGQGSLSFYDRKNLHHIAVTENPYGVKSLQELKEYPSRLKKECLEQKDIESMKNKVFQVLGYSNENEHIYENLDELKDMFPELADKHPVANFLETVYNIDNSEILKTIIEKADFNQMLKNLATVYKSMSLAYENKYRKSFLKISDIETAEVIDGVEIKKLDGQPFKMLMHRIFNFDKSQSDKVKILVENPEKWTTLTGASYISTSFISDKSIKGVMRPLYEGTTWLSLKDITPEELREYAAESKKESMKHNIAEDAVFLGFTDVPEKSLLSMAPADAMTEHGGKHADVKSRYCTFYSPDDLAYKTTGAWNEVVITRENPKTGKRILPDCIICFDGKINDNSLKWAKTWQIPVIVIDRDKYIRDNKRMRKAARASFAYDLSLSALKQLFYTTPMDDMVNFEAKDILKAIKTNSKASCADKLEALSFIQEHFDRLVDASSVPGNYFAIKLREVRGRKNVPDSKKIEKIKREIYIQKKAFSYFAKKGADSYSQTELNNYISAEQNAANHKKQKDDLEFRKALADDAKQAFR